MAPLYPWQYVYDQWRTLPDVSSFAADLSGKTVIVTGANVGLGLEAARHLARMNPGKLILGCRDPLRGEQAVQDIQSSTGCRNVHCWTLDLASFGSVIAFGERFEREGGGRLDLLIENAGLSFPTYETTSDGWETMLKVNHLGTAHLALRLLPYLLRAPADPPTPRLVVVTSEMHYFVYDQKAMMSDRILETLNSPARCRQWGVIPMRYGASKMMNILFTRALSSRLPHTTSLTANTVTPGFCHSSLTRHMSNPALSAVKYVAARSTEVGSRTLVHAALARELQGRTGEYLNACEVNEPGDFVLSEEGRMAGDRIWDQTLEVLYTADPGLRDVMHQCGLQWELYSSE